MKEFSFFMKATNVVRKIFSQNLWKYHFWKSTIYLFVICLFVNICIYQKW